MVDQREGFPPPFRNWTTFGVKMRSACGHTECGTWRTCENYICLWQVGRSKVKNILLDLRIELILNFDGDNLPAIRVIKSGAEATETGK
jgi:hypothetical protein